MPRILFINNLGTDFADYVDVPEGTTIDKFFHDKLPDQQPGDYLIRVNRQPVAKDQILAEGDRVTATPLKIEGARVNS